MADITRWKMKMSIPYRPEKRPVKTTLAVSAHSSTLNEHSPRCFRTHPIQDGRAIWFEA
jgi:hypothetical protein